MAGERRDEKVLPLWEHVAELAKLLRIWIYTFVVATIIFMVLPADLSFFQDPFASYRPLVSVVLLGVKERLLPSEVKLIPGPITAGVEVYAIASLVLGFAVSVPVLAYEIYRFVDPALRPHERRAVYPFVSSFSLLFLAGVLFGLFVVLPFIVYGTLIFNRYIGVDLLAVNSEDFYGLIFSSLLMTGFAFTLPVFLVLVVKFGVIGTKVLTRSRKYLWVSVFILTAVITPDGGPLADVALFVPIIILIEGSILVARRYEKGRPPVPDRPQTTDCRFCGGPIDSGGVFCGRCGRSQL